MKFFREQLTSPPCSRDWSYLIQWGKNINNLNYWTSHNDHHHHSNQPALMISFDPNQVAERPSPNAALGPRLWSFTSTLPPCKVIVDNVTIIWPFPHFIHNDDDTSPHHHHHHHHHYHRHHRHHHHHHHHHLRMQQGLPPPASRSPATPTSTSTQVINSDIIRIMMVIIH